MYIQSLWEQTHQRARGTRILWQSWDGGQEEALIPQTPPIFLTADNSPPPPACLSELLLPLNNNSMLQKSKTTKAKSLP